MFCCDEVFLFLEVGLHLSLVVKLLKYTPCDIIIVTAAYNHVHQPLIYQLGKGGRLLIPLGEPNQVQYLILIEK